MNEPTIRAELVGTTGYTRHACHLCGGHTEKNAVLCEVPADHPTHAGFRVCEVCLKSGDIDSRLAEHVARLEGRIAELRELRGRLVVPTFAEWEHANEQEDAAYLAEQ